MKRLLFLVIPMAAITSTACGGEEDAPLGEGAPCTKPGERRCEGDFAWRCAQPYPRVDFVDGEFVEVIDPPFWEIAQHCRGILECIESDNGDAFCSAYDQRPAGCADIELVGGYAPRAFCDGRTIGACRSGHLVGLTECDTGTTCVEPGENQATCTVSDVPDERCRAGASSVCLDEHAYARCVDGYPTTRHECFSDVCVEDGRTAACAPSEIGTAK